MIVDGREMNPRLHLTIHEIVAAQLADDDPPEVWATAQRLRRLGYGRHEILHMLGAAMAPQLWAALHDQREYDLEQHRAALAALPEAWERERPAGPARRPCRAAAARQEAATRPSARHAGEPAPLTLDLSPRASAHRQEASTDAISPTRSISPAASSRASSSTPFLARNTYVASRARHSDAVARAPRVAMNRNLRRGRLRGARERRGAPPGSPDSSG